MKTLQQIADQLAGYDPQALPTDAVGAFLQHLVQPLTETETLPLMQALGRVLAEDIISPISVPPHANSAMDGYGFASAALAQARAVGAATLQLHCVGTALAGQPWAGAVGAQQCVRITTGAVLPAGVDCVAPLEIVEVAHDQVRVPLGVLQPGENTRRAGEDLMAGQPALQKGELLTPAALGLVASLGLPDVKLARRLRVAYFSTGDEVLSLGQAMRPGAIYDSNRYTVFGLLSRLGVQVIDLGVVRDDPQALRSAFASAAAQADAIITSGGVSVGEADHTKAMMRELGDVVFWRIAMRPGRPMAVGRIDANKLADYAGVASVSSYKSDSRPCLLFGLPGNPVAVMVTFLAFVRPALLRLMGAREQELPSLRARSLERLRKKPGRTEYQRGIVSRDPVSGDWVVRTTGNQGSGVLRSMAQANGLIVLPHASTNVAVGDAVDVWPFWGLI